MPLIGRPSPDVRSQRTRPLVCFTGDAVYPLDPVDSLCPLETLSALNDVVLADTPWVVGTSSNRFIKITRFRTSSRTTCG